ncbi:SWPV2-ORF309 [Shearwaterpox virus]|uniref:SWPV2-ORF309 n=1 Tax=Shearwaterpox virus TaxID=1974596 RepID=A0A1V0QGT3_CNPV|nr:SWPV2-ORF309 [Shearwaterpox virus]
MNPRNSPEKYSPHKNSVSKMRPESSFNYDASRILTNRARIRASKHYPHTRFPNEDWTPKGILLRKYGKTKQSGNTKDVFEKSHDSVSPRELPIEKSYYKSIVYKTAAVMLLVVKIRDRLRFIRKLFRYVGDKLYAKAALTLVNRLVTPRIPVVKDLIPFYYAKKNFWKFALLYGLKKISDKAPKAR